MCSSDLIRERYGMNPLGQNLLLARRMVESGVRIVTVNGWAGQAEHDKAGPPSSSWDMHGGNMGMGNAFGNGSYGMGFCLPRLEASAAATDRPCPQVVTGSMFVTGPTAADVDASREHHRAILAFLYTTPAYRRSLGLFGWNELGERLQAMTRAGEWDRLSSLMTDEVLHALVPQATWDQLPGVVDEWFGGLVDGVMLPVPADPANDARFAEVIAAIRGSGI